MIANSHSLQQPLRLSKQSRSKYTDFAVKQSISKAAVKTDLKIRSLLFSLLLLAGPSLTVFGESRAGCTCVCVDGLNRPLCASASDPRPLCPPRVCPREPGVTRPLDQVVEPRPRNKNCARKYSFNRYSQRYEWLTLCR